MSKQTKTTKTFTARVEGYDLIGKQNLAVDYIRTSDGEDTSVFWFGEEVLLGTSDLQELKNVADILEVFAIQLKEAIEQGEKEIERD